MRWISILHGAWLCSDALYPVWQTDERLLSVVLDNLEICTKPSHTFPSFLMINIESGYFDIIRALQDCFAALLGGFNLWLLHPINYRKAVR